MTLYGYKVCYKTQGSNKWKVYLVTNTYELALWHVRWYERDPPKHLKCDVWTYTLFSRYANTKSVGAAVRFNYG